MKPGYWLLFAFIGQCLAAGVALASFYLFGQGLQAVILALTIFILSSLLLGKLIFYRISQFLYIIEQALLHFKDGEFSLSLPKQKNRQLQTLARLFDDTADKLHQDRIRLLQREFLLDRVFMTASSALLLTDERHKIVLCNPAAHQLCQQSLSIKGLTLDELKPMLAPTLADALTQHQDGLFTLEGLDDEPQIWHLTCEFFSLMGKEHCLYHFKQMTRTLSRAEVDTWKKVIRVLSHELNNSLAPISSLSHSGLKILSQTSLPEPQAGILQNIFTTVGERAAHLNTFLSGYAQFARLPTPQLTSFSWPHFIGNLQNLIPFHCQQPLPTREGYGDSAQISQVLVNLIKNAQQAGSPAAAIRLQVSALGEWDKLIISDAGCGMTKEQLSQSLLPFYTTKREGSGLGLALSREIIDAHGGRIKLANRHEGGLQVSIWLPAKVH